MATGRKHETVDRRAWELRENRFSRFYDTKKVPAETMESTSGVQNQLNTYTHSEAIDFAAATWNWQQRNRNLVLKPNKSSVEIPTHEIETGLRAYYRVLVMKKDKYILIACHINLHGFHRGDLRFVEVNKRTIVKGFEFSVIGELFPGDVVAVTKLGRRSRAKFQPVDVFSVHPDADCTWEVLNMTLLTRKADQLVDFAVLKNGVAVCEGHVEAMNVIPNTREPLELDKMYEGLAFIPETIEFNYTQDLSAGRVGLIALASHLHSYPNVLSTIYSYSFCPRQQRLLDTGYQAFKPGTDLYHSEEGGDMVEKCVRIGASAALTISGGRYDDRAFKIRDIRREGLTLRFTISNPRERPSEGLWNANNRIFLEGKFGRIDAVIETVILESQERNIRIAARMRRGISKDIRFDKGISIVQQCVPMDKMKLDSDFFEEMENGSNGSKVIKTLYGDAPIKSKVETPGIFTFPGNPEIVLNDHQNLYVSMIVADEPMVIGNSPFGCGKSMTMVTAAIEVHKRNSRLHLKYQQLLITQTNNAGVSLVEIARKSEEQNIMFLRYISESNWDLLPESAHTVFDMPVLMKDVIVDWAKRRSIDSFDDLKLFHKESLVQRAIQKYMDPGELQGQAKLVYESLSKKKRSVEPSVRVLREAFFLLYEPHVIVTTADSLNGLLESNCLNYITNVQIDEASQLPEHVLIRLLKTFPHAGFGLVGDVKQLPPHCDNELDGLLKKYGIGNTMRRASQKRMFPQSVLRHVYRCHPVTTRLLSNMIYDGHLISAIEENERNEFMRMRPDIWPNREFPILVINQEQKGYRMGTSVANDAEKTHVLRIVKCLTREVNGYQLKPDDIGIISFYRAQTSVLTEAFRGSGVKCGTIDTFQGSEREVMIVCCTNEKPSDFMQLGNRVNVAMSRARQATILIGNAEGLQCAKYWSKIVKNARENGCYIGDISKFGQNCGPDGNGGGDGSEVGDGPEEAGNRNRRHRGGRRDRDRKQNEDQQRKVEEEEKPKTATQKRRERRQRAKKRENEQKAMINQAPVAKEAPKKSRPNQKQRQVLRQKEGKDKTGGASYANVVARAGRPIVIEMSPIIDGLLNMRIKSRK